MINAPASVGVTSTNAQSVENTRPDLARVVALIRTQIQQLLSTPQPELYKRHLRSVLALCEESVLTLQFVVTDRDAQAKELLGYLNEIESGFNNEDARRSEAYLVEGRRSLDLVRISRSDGSLQFYTVSLPAHWDANKAYPLYVYLHGRESDLPLSLVASTLATQQNVDKPNDYVIIVKPWLRGNGQWREANGSEPDVWEAIDDVKSFAKLDPDRWYISGHSWGGDDVWAIALRTPDLWAAAGIMAGAVSVPPESNLVANAQYVPFYLWKGAQDPIPNRQANLEYFRDSLRQVGDPPKTVIAQGVGHNPRPEDYAAMQSWLFEHVRRRPNHFSFVIDTSQHRGIWGISIPQKYPDAYLNVEPRVSFECWIEGTLVRIQTTSTNRLAVDLGPQGLAMSGNVTLILNGKEVFRGAVPPKPLSLTW
jgi:pimeloyl-ACP methyl ester carboxylesterase